MGHIAHLSKQFKSINDYDYIITLIRRTKKTINFFLRIDWFLIWTNLNPLKPKGALCQVWLKLAQWFWRRFQISSMYFRYFVIISPWKRAWSFIWTNLNPHHPRILCAKCGWIWHRGSRKQDFKISSMY